MGAVLSGCFNVPRYDLRGKIAVVTGANCGIGLETAVALRWMGATVVLACRNVDKGTKAREEVLRRTRRGDTDADNGGVLVVELDLASLENIRGFGGRLREALGEDTKIDMLVLNAGVMLQTPLRQTTADGFELQIGTNFVGHFYLTHCLVSGNINGQLQEGCRIVSVSSIRHFETLCIDTNDFLECHNYCNCFKSYSVSKLCNLLFVEKLNRLLQERGNPHNITVVGCHPGVSNTRLFGRNRLSRLLQIPIGYALFLPQRRGALPSVLAATDPRAKPNAYAGPYLHPSWHAPKSYCTTKNQGLQDRVWEAVCQKTGVQDFFVVVEDHPGSS